jgi:hypothetical protein
VARRQQQKFAEQDAQALPPSRTRKSAQPAGSDLISSLRQLARLRESGALSEKEFSAAKGKLLAG